MEDNLVLTTRKYSNYFSEFCDTSQFSKMAEFYYFRGDISRNVGVAKMSNTNEIIELTCAKLELKILMTEVKDPHLLIY